MFKKNIQYKILKKEKNLKLILQKTMKLIIKKRKKMMIFLNQKIFFLNSNQKRII